jgi:two-component system sensor kinase FixL
MDRVWEALDARASPKPLLRARVAPYLAAVFWVALGVGARLALDPLLGDRVVFLFFVPAVLVAAATGGLWPGLAATVLSYVAGEILLRRYGLIVIGNEVDGGLFVLLGVAISYGGGLRKARSVAADMSRHVLQREAHLKSILDGAPDAMIVINEEGRILAFSPAAEKLFQRTREEVTGHNISLLMMSPAGEEHDSHLERYAQTGVRHAIGIPRIVMARRRDGSALPVELFISETIIEGRRFFAGFLRDLTERQAVELQLRTHSELAHISRLTAMGGMAAALAHELNQPLAAISNYLKGGQRFLEVENPHSRALHSMVKAAEQSLRAGDIIRRLRDFIGRGDGDRAVESLRTLVEEASSLGLVGARERGIISRARWTAAADAVLVDKVQVQQVLFNLVRNAIQAMEGCEVRELSLVTSIGANGMAMVSVADTGPGISPQVASRLFQPFVTTKGIDGMGVGLSICRSIVEAHGGRIWAEANVPTGTIFHFTLPRAVLEAAA